jgi:hypothetical protein
MSDPTEKTIPLNVRLKPAVERKRCQEPLFAVTR